MLLVEFWSPGIRNCQLLENEIACELRNLDRGEGFELGEHRTGARVTELVIRLVLVVITFIVAILFLEGIKRVRICTVRRPGPAGSSQ